jgi:hypothetical protein
MTVPQLGHCHLPGRVLAVPGRGGRGHHGGYGPLRPPSRP